MRWHRLNGSPRQILSHVVVGCLATAIGIVIATAGSPPVARGASPGQPALDGSSSPSPTEVQRPLAGIGPLIVYALDGTESTEIRALDLGADPPVSFLLGQIEGGLAWPPTHGDGTVTVVPGFDGLRILTRGDRLGDRLIHPRHHVGATAVSPDGRWLAVATRTTDSSVRITLHAIASASDRREMASFTTVSDANGGGFEMFWRSPTGLTVLDGCHCDGGPGFASISSVSVGGERRELSFLGEQVPYRAGPQDGGALFAYDDIPNVDCFEREGACDALPHTLTVADPSAGTIRRVARRIDENFGDPVLSPGGSFVAASAWGSDTIEIYDVRAGRPINTASFTAAELAPAAWLDDRRLIAVATSPDFVGERETGVLLLLERGPRGSHSEPTILASGVGLRYLGWIR